MPYGACYLLCITRTDTHQLLLWMTRRLGQSKKLKGVEAAERLRGRIEKTSRVASMKI